MPTYRLQIVDDSDAVVMAGPPGSREPFEVDLIARCTGVGAVDGVGAAYVLSDWAGSGAAVASGLMAIVSAAEGTSAVSTSASLILND